MRFFPNLLTVSRIVISLVLVYLALTDPDNATLAFGLFAIALATQPADGVLAAQLGVAVPADSRWGFLDMVVGSFMLTAASLFWLCEADVLPYWSLLFLAFGPVVEFLYVVPRKGKRPFVPIVLIGSLAYWLIATCLFAVEAGSSVIIGVMMVSLLLVFHVVGHPERIKEIVDECRNRG